MNQLDQKIKVGISSCLTGEMVRYDGSHRKDSNIIETFTELFELIPVCPEVEIGLGVPREPITLVCIGSELRCVGTLTSDLDVTGQLTDCANQQCALHSDLCGYIFKARSPSCGLKAEPVSQDNQSRPTGIGIYAAQLQRNFTDLPVIESEPLADPAIRERFVQQVKAYHHRVQVSSTR
ncbi:MAG: hypothetical protein DRQ60_05190 [Gammaproteobacteria bacterium]|nr:MAG: hypothetical protein DRQ60_05190 [Gammaproteobacteria bacterium]